MRQLDFHRLFVALVAILTCLIALASLRDASAQSPERYEQTWPMMGVKLRIVGYANNRELATRAFDAAYKRVMSLDKTLSNYRTDSEIAVLAKQPSRTPFKPSRDLWAILCLSDSISRATGGAFDVTLAPLTDLWRDARKLRKLPSASKIATAKATTGYEKIEFDCCHCTIQFVTDSIRLDFGGIGKGFAADQALTVLAEHGITQAMVDVGGDLAIGDPPPGAEGWKIGVGQVNPGQPVTHYVLLKGCGVATSGDAYQFVEVDGVRYSHILDPKTGMGLTRRGRITVIATSAACADAYASAFSVLGREESTSIADQTVGLEMAGDEVTADGKTTVFQSSGFPKRNKIER